MTADSNVNPFAPNLTDAQEYYERLIGCCLEAEDFEPAGRATKVHLFVESVPDEESGGAVFEAPDGFWVYEESQDYTGHGCRCGADVAGPFPDLDTAIRFGLTKSMRAILGVSLPEDVNE